MDAMNWNDPEPEEEDPAAAADPAQDADYWKQKYQDHFKQSERTVTDLSEQARATNQLLERMVALTAERAAAPSAAAPNNNGGGGAADYLTRLANGGGQQQVPDLSKFVSAEDVDKRAAEIAQKKINENIQQANQYQNAMQQVHAKFMAEEPDLAQYEELAAEFFHASGGDLGQKYHAAVGKVKGLIAAGKLPAPQKQQRMAGTPSGGQMANSWSSNNRGQGGAEAPPKDPTMEDMRAEQAEWVKQKKEIQQARMDIRTPQKVSKLDFSLR